MNKTEKLIAILLGLVLAGYLYFDMVSKPSSASSHDSASTQVSTKTSIPATKAPAPAALQPSGPETPAPAKPSVPEETVELANAELRLTLTTWGAAVKSATLLKYPTLNAPISAENPAVSFDFAEDPVGATDHEAWTVAAKTEKSVTFTKGAESRTITLEPNYQVVMKTEGGALGDRALPVSLGSVGMGSSKNDTLSVDAWGLGPKAKYQVYHFSEEEPLKDYLVGTIGGCSGAKNAAGMPKTATIPVGTPDCKWIALKNRFFVCALASSSVRVDGFTADVTRDTRAQTYRPAAVAARANLAPAGANAVDLRFYIGPKDQSLLSDLGMRDVMEFGMWRWLCYPIVTLLDWFYKAIPNYGIAIILLTILTRLIFWPLTHKSTVSMKKMTEIQPLMKEVQTKYKDNPQRLQQEMMALYREHHVNPMSSCLPMLIQIPVFIALFNVLRAAVELRYSHFLWIADLSEPEGLFAAWFPFGGLNILPILMAATMALQTALTPQTGDKNQQRMMMIMMPVMMLVMFYNFPSALSLYWTLSQVISIVQMWWIRKASSKEQVARSK